MSWTDIDYLTEEEIETTYGGDPTAIYPIEREEA